MDTFPFSKANGTWKVEAQIILTLDVILIGYSTQFTKLDWAVMRTEQ